MEEIKFRGGARIGNMSSSWPFVTLTISKETLTLKIPLFGEYTFKASDVISLEPFTYFLNKGIRIKHRIQGYKEKIEFWTFKDPQAIIDQARMIGFPI